jgi:hypothetical protein
MENQVRVYKVISIKLEWFKDMIKKLNKKASKLGCNPITYEIGEMVKTPIISDLTGEIVGYKVHYPVTVQGDAPKFEGWLFIATLQHSETGNIIRKIVDFEVPELYRTAEKKCDHCGYIRNRKDTYVVKHDNGEYKQVGKACLKDFLGHTSPERIAFLASFMDTLNSNWDEEDEKGSRGETLYDTKAILALSSAVITKFGWVSKAKADEYQKSSTCDRVTAQFRPEYLKEEDKVSVEENDSLVAEKTLAWVAALSNKETKSDYEHNLISVCLNTYLEFRSLGIAISAVSAYQREMDKERLERERTKDRALSEWVGTVGDKIEIEALLLAKKTFEGHYGQTTFYLFKQGANLFSWFASKEHELELEKTYSIKARIKKHDEYKGSKQTALTRCKAKVVETITVKTD